MTEAKKIGATVTALVAKADALSIRERVLIFATLLAVGGTLWYLTLMQPLLQQADRTRAEIGAVQARIQAANQSLEDQVLQLAQADSTNRTRYAIVQQRIDEIDAALEEYSGKLVDPAEMAFVLESVLKSQSRLRLKHIRNLEAEPLTADGDDGLVILYRHGLEIEVEGSYFDCLAYLEEIESLPWRLYWQFLDLDVLEYPNNRIRIEVSTLSLDEEWIGA